MVKQTLGDTASHVAQTNKSEFYLLRGKWFHIISSTLFELGAAIHLPQAYSAACQPRPGLNLGIAFASFSVFGPRSFSYTTLFWSTMNVSTPDDRYSTG